jgi:hypothetical protein
MYVALTTKQREAEQEGDDVVCCHRVEPRGVKCNGCLRVQAAIDTGEWTEDEAQAERRQARLDEIRAQHLASKARRHAARAERMARRARRPVGYQPPRPKRKREFVPLDVITRLMKLTRQKAIAKADLRYNVKLTTLDRMVVAQRGKCAICRHGGGKLFVDHCHACGEVRGLLDHACNTRVGRVEAKMLSYQRVISYIRRTTLCRYGRKVADNQMTLSAVA